MAIPKISSYLIGIVIFTIIIVSGVSMFAIYSNEDPTFTNDSKFIAFNNSMNKLSDVNTQINSLQSSIEDTNDSSNFFAEQFGFVDDLVGKSWRTMKLIGSNFAFMNSAFYGFVDLVGGENSKASGYLKVVAALVISIITLIIVFGAWSALFQRDV